MKTRDWTFSFPVAALLMTTPPYEWPTSTIGPSIVARKLRRYSPSLVGPRSGFEKATTG